MMGYIPVKQVKLTGRLMLPGVAPLKTMPAMPLRYADGVLFDEVVAAIAIVKVDVYFQIIVKDNIIHASVLDSKVTDTFYKLVIYQYISGIDDVVISHATIALLTFILIFCDCEYELAEICTTQTVNINVISFIVSRNFLFNSLLIHLQLVFVFFILLY